jgi:CTP:molybdopterin cytidylyltransferase MocA
VTAVVETFAAAGIADIVVVTGRDHDRIVEALATARLPVPARISRNVNPSRGQLSSLLTGMDASVTSETQAVVVTLVDVPLLAAETVRLVVSEWQRTRAPIVRPAIGDRHGHPVIFDRRVFAELRSAPPDLGAKSVVRAHADELVNVPVTDEGCPRGRRHARGLQGPFVGPRFTVLTLLSSSPTSTDIPWQSRVCRTSFTRPLTRPLTTIAPLPCVWTVVRTMPRAGML